MKYCPNCCHTLIDNKKLSQGVKECGHCKGRYFILQTKKPKE